MARRSRGLEPAGFRSSDKQRHDASAAAQTNNSSASSPRGQESPHRPAHVHRPTEENTTEDDEGRVVVSGLDGLDGDDDDDVEEQGEEGEEERMDELDNVDMHNNIPLNGGGTKTRGREVKTHIDVDKKIGGEDYRDHHDGEILDDDDEEEENNSQFDEEDEVTTPASATGPDCDSPPDMQNAQQHLAAEEASRALSKLQLQGSTANEQQQQQNENNSLVPHGLPSPQLQSNGPNGTSETLLTEDQMRALTVLPPNELSATTSDAAMAADTFADMMHDGMGWGNDVDGIDPELMGEGIGVGCPPGLVVDGSGVVRRTTQGGAGAGMGGVNEGGVKAGSGPHHGHHPHHPHHSAQGGGGMGAGGSPGRVGGSATKGGGSSHHHQSNMDPMMQDPDVADPDATQAVLSASEEEEEEEEEEEDSSEISASDEDGSWIAWFCNLRGNEFFCEVDEDYIQDDFNLTGLNGLVPYYDYALDMVLDVEMPMEDSLTEEQQEIVESAAEMLYGLIHARYIVTNRGMHAMYEKYRSASFGRCPHVFCQGQPVLPVGLSDLPRNYTVNVFCPRCHGLFFPKSTRQANIDGAYFGTTFPHLYLMTHPVRLFFVNGESALFCLRHTLQFDLTHCLLFLLHRK